MSAVFWRMSSGREDDEDMVLCENEEKIEEEGEEDREEGRLKESVKVVDGAVKGDVA
jgi:hypothetical protein